MRWIAPLLLPLLAWLTQPAAAQALSYQLDFDAAQAAPTAKAAGDRIVDLAPPQHEVPGAGYGPFRILDDTHAALVGVTNHTSVAAFEAMLRDHPGIATIEMIDCPGSEDDYANLQLGRMIRARGIATHVPDDGFV